MKKELQQEALKLRQKGYSMKEISDRIQVAKSTVYVWVKDVVLSVKAKRRLFVRGEKGREKGKQTNRKKRSQVLKKIQERVKNDFKQIVSSREMSKLLCAILHWCEGNKQPSSVGFTNSDPVMMRTYVQLLRSAFDLDENKFSLCLHLHE